MRIALVTPANLGSKSGNSITAVRWTAILNGLGHKVAIMNEYSDKPTDLMIALNAYRSRKSIQLFKARHPEKPLVIALTGTDLYRFMDSNREEVLSAIGLADRLVVLSNLAINRIPSSQRQKAYLIYESAKPLPSGRHPSRGYFDICLIGHLRSEKDPLLAPLAARKLPKTSRIRIRHYGKAHSDEWAEKANNEMLTNPRYTWFGEVAHWKVRLALAKCNLMILTSRIEGGPNSLSEAIVAGVPVITTDIDGCVGVLGQSYPGYFPVGDSEALTELLTQAETDKEFLAELEKYIVKIEAQFSWQEEEARWEDLLAELSANKKNRTV